MNLKPFLGLLLGVGALAPMAAFADGCFQQPQPWMVRVGGHNIDPTGGTSNTSAGGVAVDSKFGLTLNLDYRLCKNLSVDVLGSQLFTHDIKLNGTKVGTTQLLPPTLTLQYHILPDTRFDPFIGVGVNYTHFWHERINAPGVGLHLSPTFGFAAQAGVDIALAPRWVLGVDVRYIQIEPDAYVNGTKIGTVNVDPLAYGVNFGYRF